MKPVVRCVNREPCQLQDNVDRLLIVLVETDTLKICGTHEICMLVWSSGHLSGMSKALL